MVTLEVEGMERKKQRHVEEVFIVPTPVLMDNPPRNAYGW